MLFRSTVAVAAGAALLSFAVAAPAEKVCKVVVSVGYGEPSWVPAKPEPSSSADKPKGDNPYPSATWGDWSNWTEEPLRTTTLKNSDVNPRPTNWHGWKPAPSSDKPSSAHPTTTEAPKPPKPTGGWAPWTGWTATTSYGGGNGTYTTTSTTTTSSGNGTVTTTTTATSTSTSETTTSTSETTTITSMTTTTTTSETTTTTTTETTTTTPALCPEPTVSFVIRGIDNEDANNNYVELVRTQLDLTVAAFSQPDSSLAQVWNFNEDCQLTAGPRVLGIIQDDEPASPYNQYAEIPGEVPEIYTFTPNACVVDANDIITCEAAGQNIFQIPAGDDVWQIGDELYENPVTVIIERLE